MIRARRTHPAAAVVIALGLAGAGEAIAATEQRLVEMQRPTPVAAHGDVVAVSTYDPATDRYQLAVVRGGQAVALPIAPRAVPFDVDAGPAEDGGVVLAYSRCATEPANRGPGEGLLPDWSTGRGCDVYRYDISTGRESRISGASTGGASEYLPSIWRDEVAFARVYERREGARGRYPYLYARPLGADGPTSRRQPGGARGRNGFENGPVDLDLYGRRVAFVWASFPRPDASIQQGVRSGFDDELRLDTVGGGHRRVDTVGGDSVNKSVDYQSVSMERGRVFYLQECFGDCADERSRREHRHRISTDERSTAVLPAATVRVPERHYVSAVRNEDSTLAVRGPIRVDPSRPSAPEWELVELDGLRFDD